MTCARDGSVSPHSPPAEGPSKYSPWSRIRTTVAFLTAALADPGLAGSGLSSLGGWVAPFAAFDRRCFEGDTLAGFGSAGFSGVTAGADWSDNRSMICGVMSIESADQTTDRFRIRPHPSHRPARTGARSTLSTAVRWFSLA